MIQLFNNDCRVELKRLPDNSIDAVVTDPPYELGFMGKRWDKSGIAYNVDLWREVLRVLKPGGHLLSFGGSRTYHRMTCAIEDAGFEIRDMIEWVYGSGFPKSLDVGKAIDKLQNNERIELGENPNNRPNCDKTSTLYELGFRKEKGRGNKITKGDSVWEGYGSALKPAHEPICMARKPLSEKSIAENILKWGVGAINIDRCRIPGEKGAGVWGSSNKNCQGGRVFNASPAGEKFKSEQHPGGRFPANFIHDGSEEVVEMFPKSSTTGNRRIKNRTQQEAVFTPFTRSQDAPEYTDSGSAARFFYTAKASKKERSLGCENLLDKIAGLRSNTSGQHITRRAGDDPGPVKNHHPCVKPIALMQYLCRLITPPKGIVLDPFMGSGTTGIAAIRENFKFIGIDDDPEYFKIAQARLREIQPNLL